MDSRKFPPITAGAGGGDASVEGTGGMIGTGGAVGTSGTGGTDGTAPTAGGTPRLEVGTPSVALGPVALGFPSRARLAITNAGNAVSPAPDVSWAEPKDADLALVQNQCLNDIEPGQSCELRVQFVPSKAGPAAGTLHVASSTGEAADVPFTGLGLVAGNLLVVPAAGSFEDFGNVTVGSTTEGVFTILNTSTSPTDPLTFSINQSAFVLLPPGDATGTTPADAPCAAGSTLAGGASCALRVGFTPTARGPIEATLTSISGGATGVSTTLFGKGIVKGALTASTPALDFAGVIPGEAAERSVAIKNAGDQPLTLAGAVIEPADASLFSVASSTCGANVVLAAGASCDLQLEFRPLAAGVPSTADLVVTAADGQSQRVALTGAGLKPGNLTLAAATAGEEGFGDVVLGESSVHVFQIGSPGAQPSGVLSLSATNGFSIDPAAAEGDCTPETSLVDAATCSVNVRFAPTERGPAAGALTVNADLAGATSLVLAGNGLAPAAIDAATEVNFGRLTMGETAQRTLTLRNTGDQPLPRPTIGLTSVTQPEQAAAFAFSDGCTAPLALDETCDVTLTFTPSLAIAHSATLDVTATPGGRLSVLLLGQAIAKGSLVLAAATEGGADFGDVALGATATSTFTLSNPGTEAAGPISLRSDNAAFVAQPGDCNPTDPTGLGAGASCSFDVTFTPVERAPAVGRLVVLSATLGEASVELRGVGRGPATLEATATRDLGLANLGQDPGPLNQFTWTVNNTGDLPTAALQVVSSNGIEFQVSNDTCSNAPVTARATCQMLIGFRPSQAGPRSGAITVTDPGGGSTLTLALTGTGQRVAQPGESCINAVCAEGTCTAGVCCDRACDRTCQVCSATGTCVDQDSQESCGAGARCFGVDQCLLPAGATCNRDSDCGGGNLCKACAGGGRQCTAPDACCGGCPNGLSCVGGSCGCTAAQTDCGGGLCISRNDPLACCPATPGCSGATPRCTNAGRCVECLTSTDCGACEQCNGAGSCVAAPSGTTDNRCDTPQKICDGGGGCTPPECNPAAGVGCSNQCTTCVNFKCENSPPGTNCDGTAFCNGNGVCQDCVVDDNCGTCIRCNQGFCERFTEGEADPRCGSPGTVCTADSQCTFPQCNTLTAGPTGGCPPCQTCVGLSCTSIITETDQSQVGLRCEGGYPDLGYCDDRGQCTPCSAALGVGCPADLVCVFDGTCQPL